MPAEGGYFMRDHSLVAPYQGANIKPSPVCANMWFLTGTGMDIPNWEFGGTSVVTSSYVRLTPDRQSKQGNLWNTAVSVFTIYHEQLFFNDCGFH